MIGVVSFRRAVVLALVAVLASGSSRSHAAVGESAVRSGARARQLRSDASLDPALRAALVRAVQANAGDRWSLVPAGRDRFVAQEDGVALVVSSGGVEVVAADVRARIAAARFGRGLGEPLEDAALAVTRNEARLARDGLVERWVHGPLGLEHLFDVSAPLPGTGALIVELSVSGGLSPRDAGGAIELVDGRGRVRARYGDAWAEDASHRALPIRLEVRGDRVALLVDDAEAAYPIAIDPLLFVEQAALSASDGAADDWFGLSVALSSGRALVGAPFDDVGANLEQGSVYVFRRTTGSTWVSDARLLNPEGGLATERFGESVALSGVVALVGALRAGGVADPRGAAFPFAWVGTGWTPCPTLRPAAGEAYDDFGASVALVADTGTTPLLAAVGAPADDVGADVDRGSVHLFAGTAYGGSWTPVTMLTASDGVAGDRYGTRLALVPGRLAVGVPNDDVGAATDAGSVYVHVRSGTAWSQEAHLVAAGGASSDELGTSVALEDARLVAGANGVGSFVGRAYVFDRGAGGWSPAATLMASDATNFQGFGVSVALAADRIAVGASGRAGTTINEGAVYVFERAASGTWTEAAIVVASDASSGDSFGNATALDGDELLVGAYMNDFGVESDQGSAYVGALFARNGDACTTDAECGPGTCVDGVCCTTSCGGGATDDCQACSIAAGGTIDGTCTALSAIAAPTVACHPTRGGCDPEELCVAGSTTCPTDALYASGFPCRPLAGTCDEIERCDGVTAACPADVLRRVGDICLLADASNPCDADDVCSGSTPDCPARSAPVTTPCGDPPSGECDAADHCAGVAPTCVDAFLSGVECRPSDGACDAPEVCLGDGPTCPGDAFESAGMPCRTSTAACDPAESCDGASAECPADVTTCGMVDAGPVDGGTDASADAAGDAGEAGPAPAAGCSCRVHGRSSSAIALVGLTLLGACLRTRRSRAPQRT